MATILQDDNGQYYLESDDGTLKQVDPSIIDQVLPGGAVNPNDPKGFWDRADIALGRTFQQIGRTLKEPFMSEEEVAQMAQTQRTEDQIYGPFEQRYPYATLTGEAAAFAPSMLIPGGQGLAARTATTGGIGALEGFLRWQPEPGLQTQQALEGGAFSLLGMGVGNMATRVLKGLASALDMKGLNRLFGIDDAPRVVDDVQDFVEAGGKVTPGERLGSDSLRGFEAGLESVPFGGNLKKRAMEENAQILGDKAAQSIGLPPGTRMGPDALNSAEELISDQYDMLFRQGNIGNVRVSEKLQKQLLKDPEVKALIDRGDDFLGLEDGVLMGGDEFLRARQVLAGMQKTASDKNRTVLSGRLLEDIGELEDSASEFLSRAEFDQFGRIREQYRNLKYVLEKGRAVTDSGISPKILNNNMRKVYDKRYTRNQTEGLQPETADLMNFARKGVQSNVLPVVADTGTALRRNVAVMAGDVGEFAATQDPGVLARIFAAPLIGQGYSLAAEKAPGLIQGLVDPIQRREGERLGAIMMNEFLLDSVNRDE
jgi:hypothetical protein